MLKKYFTSFIKSNHGFKKQTLNMKFTNKTLFKFEKPVQNKPPILDDQQKKELEETLNSKEKLENNLSGDPYFDSLTDFEKKMIAAEEKCKKKRNFNKLV
jgi:uncharacterized protein YwgA